MLSAWTGLEMYIRKTSHSRATCYSSDFKRQADTRFGYFKWYMGLWAGRAIVLLVTIIEYYDNCKSFRMESLRSRKSDERTLGGTLCQEVLLK